MVYQNIICLLNKAHQLIYKLNSLSYQNRILYVGLKKVLAMAIREIPRAVGRSAVPKCAMNYALWAEPKATCTMYANRVHHATFVNIDTIASSYKTAIVHCLEWIGFVLTCAYEMFDVRPKIRIELYVTKYLNRK